MDYERGNFSDSRTSSGEETAGGIADPGVAWTDRHMASVSVKSGLEPMSVCSLGRPPLHQDAGLQPRGWDPTTSPGPLPCEVGHQTQAPACGKRRETPGAALSVPGTWCFGKTGLAAAAPAPALPPQLAGALGTPARSGQCGERSKWLTGPWAAGGLGVTGISGDGAEEGAGETALRGAEGTTGSLSQAGSRAHSCYAVLPPPSRAGDGLRLPPDISRVRGGLCGGVVSTWDELFGCPHPTLLIAESLLSTCKMGRPPIQTWL